MGILGAVVLPFLLAEAPRGEGGRLREGPLRWRGWAKLRGWLVIGAQSDLGASFALQVPVSRDGKAGTRWMEAHDGEAGQRPPLAIASASRTKSTHASSPRLPRPAADDLSPQHAVFPDDAGRAHHVQLLPEARLLLFHLRLALAQHDVQLGRRVVLDACPPAALDVEPLDVLALVGPRVRWACQRGSREVCARLGNVLSGKGEKSRVKRVTQ